MLSILICVVRPAPQYSYSTLLLLLGDVSNVKSRSPQHYRFPSKDFHSQRFHSGLRTARSARRHGGPSGRLVPCGTLHISGVPLSQRAVRGSFKRHVPGLEQYVGSVVAASRAPRLLPMAARWLASRKAREPTLTEANVGRRYVPHACLTVFRSQGGNCHAHADRSRPTCVECPPHSRLVCAYAAFLVCRRQMWPPSTAAAPAVFDTSECFNMRTKRTRRGPSTGSNGEARTMLVGLKAWSHAWSSGW